MTNWLDLLIRVGSFLWGVGLIACAFVGGNKLIFPNKPISQKNRVLRSMVVWILMTLAIQGVLFLVSVFYAEKMRLEDITRIILASVLFLPLTFAAAIGTYRRLWVHTKMPEDLLFLDDDKRRKD